MFFSRASCACPARQLPPPKTANPPQETTQLSTLLEQQTSWKFECEGNHCILNGDVELPLPATRASSSPIRSRSSPTRSRSSRAGTWSFTNQEGRLAAESVEFDLKKQTGTFHVATGPCRSAPAPIHGSSATSRPTSYFWGKTIERLGDQKYRITRGGFTTCVQPTPRWELVTGSVVLNLNDYAVATNTVLRVKGVPVMYMPWVYYPIQDDDRATGFLLPTYGTSTLRGQAISNAFFWAIGRSQDATFFHDWFTNTGQGAGVEYRYVAAAQSSGNLRLYRIDQHEAKFTDDGQTTTLPATKSFEVSGHHVSHRLAQRSRPRPARILLERRHATALLPGRLQGHAEQSRDRRRPDRRIRPTSTNLLYSRSEYLSDASNSTVYGSTPRVSTNVAPQRLFGSPVYASMNAEYAYLPNRSMTDGVVTNDDSHARVDMTPTLRVPLSRLTFLSVNTSANYRATYYSRSAGPTGGTVSDPYFRQYIALRHRHRGAGVHAHLGSPRRACSPNVSSTSSSRHSRSTSRAASRTSPGRPSWATSRSSWLAARHNSPTA